MLIFKIFNAERAKFINSLFILFMPSYWIELKFKLNNQPENIAKAELRNKITLVLKKTVVSPQ